MCIICNYYELGKLTRFEAYNALNEMINTETIDPDHVEKVHELIWMEEPSGQ